MKKKIIIPMLLGMFFIIVGFTNVGFGATVTVNITNNTVGGFNDTRVSESQPEYNFGSSNIIYAKWNTGNTFRSYIKINLSSIDSLSSPNYIISATYCAFLTSWEIGVRNFSVMFVNDTNWIEGKADSENCAANDVCGNGITWSKALYSTQQPCSNVSGTPDGTCVDLDSNYTTTPNNAAYLACWNVTKSARNYNTSSKSFSIMLTNEINSVGTNTNKLFNSKEATSSTPFLTLTYNTAPLKRNLLITGGNGFLKMFGLKMLW